MLSLEERHADRAKRKFENMQDYQGGDISGRVGNAATLMEAAQTAFNALTDEEKEELKAAFKDREPGEVYSANDETGNFAYAGIGIVNPLIVPQAQIPEGVDLSMVREQAGNGGAAAWGGGNLNGAAVAAASQDAGSPSPEEAAAGGGWGSVEGPKAVRESMPKADLEAIASDEGVDLSSATNNADRVRLIEEARKAKSEA